MLSQNEGNRDAASSDKVYAGEFSARQRGDCRVFLTARGVVDSGNLFVRAASVGFIVVPDSARLGSIHESTTRNQMDLIQNVTVTADVAVKNPGKYEFQINFVSTDGLRSIFARAEKMLGAGSQQIGAQFPATDLQTLGDGPYLRRGVRLRRLDAREPIDQDVDWIEDAGASSGYRAADIDRGAFYFTGSRSVTTWKSDTHATLDGIRITLGLFSPGGDCVWSGKLSDGAGKTVGTSARYDTLPSGLTIIPVEFQGYQIAQSHKAGPYKLSSVRVTCKGARHELFSSSDSISVLTPPYTASQFTYVARDAVIVGPPVLTIVRGSAPQTVHVHRGQHWRSPRNCAFSNSKSSYRHFCPVRG
jgi:hypothetical protein